MKLILLGAPGAGKGTQAAFICEKYKIPQISTGDILRDNIRRNTSLGITAKEYMNKGELVPDDLVIDLVRDRLKQGDCINGYILDGFPRNILQAKKLSEFVSLDCVLHIDQAKEVIVKRLSGRLTCKQCGNVTHKDWLNGKSICPKCTGELYVRDDDKPETILHRFEEYEKQTKPLIEYYNNSKMLITVHGKDNAEGTFAEIEKILKGIK